MKESTRLSAASGSTHREHDSDPLVPRSSFIGSQVRTPIADHHSHNGPSHLHEILSLTPSQVTSERSPVRKCSADLEQAWLGARLVRPLTETRVEGQHKTDSSSSDGRESLDTVTGPLNSVTPTQANPSGNTVPLVPPTSRQPQTSPFSSQDGHGVSNPEVDTSQSIIGPAEIRRHAPLPPLPRATGPGTSHSLNPSSTNPHYNHALNRLARTQRSHTDWLIPAPEKDKSVGERLDPTLHIARIERDKSASRAKITGYTLNIAIGLQVLIGALTTGLSAAATGPRASIATAILGGIATLIASYLARARGSHEPEFSTARVKDLERFIRDCEIFQLDHGHSIGNTNPEQETRLHELRERFEELLGYGNGERRLAHPA